MRGTRLQFQLERIERAPVRHGRSPAGYRGIAKAKPVSPRGIGRMPKQRHGVCHRCGWAAPIWRFGLGERWRAGTGMAFGRLCADCRVTVAEQGRSVAAGPAPRGARLLHRWDAA